MSFKPLMPFLARRVTGPEGIPPDTVIYSGEPCACWLSRGRELKGSNVYEPHITAQVAMGTNRYFDPPGWSGFPPTWNCRKADRFVITNSGVAPFPTFAVASAGFMWFGTPDSHVRFNCTKVIDFVPNPQTAFYTGRTDGQTVTFDIFRPFGGALITAGAVGVFYSDNPIGRGSYSGGNYYSWTHFLDVSVGIDIRDGSSRVGGLDSFAYADGDGVKIPSGAGSTKYVVVFVAPMRDLTGTLFHRVYLFRDQAVWPMVP